MTRRSLERMPVRMLALNAFERFPAAEVSRVPVKVLKTLDTAINAEFKLSTIVYIKSPVVVVVGTTDEEHEG